MRLPSFFLGFLVFAAVGLSAQHFDVIVYGGTAAGVTAAVQAKRMGKSVAIIGPDRHLGGMSSGGLGATDSGNRASVGGLAREFYHRIWKYYLRDEAWKWQSRDEFMDTPRGKASTRPEQTMWLFEPSAAKAVFQDLVREQAIPVFLDEWLNRENGVRKEGTRIVAITMLSGKTFEAAMFIDATYEGDLMAAAKVSYRIGRESRAEFGEKWNGVQTGVLHHRHHFGVLSERISPYVIPGDPSSGVLARISTESPGEFGAADHRVQAYNFRVCLTNDPANRVPFPRPPGYDPRQYELLLRIFEAGWREATTKFDRIPNHKTDSNNHGPFSTDNIGYNYDYPEASYERRQEIVQEHITYHQGLLYFTGNDPRVPESVRTAMQAWGLAADEFQDNANWPHQLYVREARRMDGHFIMTEHELLKRRPVREPVGMGSYSMDSHNTQRYITADGWVQNEGDAGTSTKGPYGIALGALLPKRNECQNLVVAICVSSTHIAFCSIRMEPVFMILGQSAGTIAALAIDAEVPVQDLPYARVRARLLADRQVLETPR